MPLHLLGKKSWNVYNADNIARVRRDEAQAKAREEEDERVMQEVDAERRIKILRGERPPTPPPAPSPLSSEPGVRSDRKSTSDAGGFRKRRRVAGEDDTDRDIRYAREDAAQAVAKREELILASRKADSAQAPILDEAGHINLFPATSAKMEKNHEAEAEAARKKRSYEDQYTMRFSNAAGFKETIDRKPWYSSAEQNATAPGPMPEKDVWGNEDPRRKERTQARMSANDPLMAIKRGVRQLKTTEQERKRWNDEKRREIENLKAEETRQSRRRRRRSPSVDSLNGFKLDAPDGEREKDRRSSDRHHRRRRDQSRDRSYHRPHHYSSHRSQRHRHDERSEAPRRVKHSEAKNQP
ncbi:hypothetical protein N7491_004871 [Penicillium cf. griseofulvum]|uniref:CBF1-interacting co-repressor CIR N-terminal domain-containing protein n=1 Tax=Penicillium cf. griseofulvum TaxID=2972120 RepID=A0A9W9J594_9EURO|nr:hypothetical protein N7472_007564 [Penicillium cf. griseofulvum]KAJ5434276.1 hypothetical protein N7491_004871 [Penicillium cf. griseofulvum]KAJ5452106.1 hypothetical protein N7445_000289 [Penicillium cf. griseofulvum]